jgi:hypothetical protein
MTASVPHKPQFSFPSSGNHIPEDKNQRLVQTPYGRGLVIRTNREDGMRDVQLLDWTQPRSASTTKTVAPMIRPAMLYTCANNYLPSVTPTVGDDVLVVPGLRGRVLQIRPHDGMIQVLVSSWRLNGRSRVTCFVPSSSSSSLSRTMVEVVRHKKIYEMSVYEKVEHAQELKMAAAEQFKQKDYSGALETYSKAVDAVRYVQHKPDSTNEVRADLLVTMVTCSNNAGMCCTQLKRWDDAEKFAKNALALIEALEEKKGLRIHKILNRDGFDDIKLFGEWLVRSNVILARALLEKGENVYAMDIAKLAGQVIAKYTTEEYRQHQPEQAATVKQLLILGKEVKRLFTLCKDQRKAHLKKEKMRAQAMFGGSASSSKGNDALPPSVSQDEITVTRSNSSSPPRNGMVANTPDGRSKATETKNKKKVSFQEETTDQTTAAADVEDEWYQDPEVLTGLAIFTGAVFVTIVSLTYLLSKRRRS